MEVGREGGEPCNGDFQWQRGPRVWKMGKERKGSLRRRVLPPPHPYFHNEPELCRMVCWLGW